MVRYIHLNPIRAGVCKTLRGLDTYQWCGHAVLVGKRAWDIQNTRDVLRYFAKQKNIALERYQSFMKEGLVGDPEIYTVIRKNNHDSEDVHQTGCWVIGNKEFVQKALSKDTLKRTRIKEYVRQGITLDGIATEVLKHYKLSKGAMVTRGRNNAQSEARKAFAFKANRYYQFPVCEIARYLNISSQSTSNLIRKGEKKTSCSKI
jgi:predicted DNA binding protein